MPERGHQTPAVGIVAAVMLAAALILGVSGCDAHSKPAVATEAPETLSGVTATTSPLVTTAAPSSGAPSVSLGAGSPSSGPTSPVSSPIVGLSALNSAYPSAAAAVPAAIQVVRDFFDGINHEMDTGDETAVFKVIYSTCTRCINSVASIKDLLDEHHTIRGGHLHLLTIDRAYPSYSNIVTVVATNTQDAGQQLDSKGNVTKAFPSVQQTELIFDVLVDHDPPVIGMLSVGSN